MPILLLVNVQVVIVVNIVENEIHAIQTLVDTMEYAWRKVSTTNAVVWADGVDKDARMKTGAHPTHARREACV